MPKSQVLKVAKKEGAIPFDTPGADLHHREDLCTFNVIIEEYGLTEPGLLILADIVKAADTDRLEDNAIAAGLEAIAVGFSLRFPDDHENLEYQFEVYDALYAWCRLQAVSKTGCQ